MTTQSQSLEVTDQLGAAGATAPRISLDFIKSQIAVEWTYTLDKMVPKSESFASVAHLIRHITVCVLLMKSGFVVIGKAAPMSSDNFDAEKGRTFAYEDAMRQLWPMFAFAAKQQAVGGV